MTTRHRLRLGQPPRPFRMTQVWGLALVGMLAMSGCAANDRGGSDATRVLQSVNVQLGSDGGVRTVSGIAALLHEPTGAMERVSTEYVPAQVVNDVPVRVTTRYRTAERSGIDLDDLRGYTGRVEIDVMLENLTVAARDLEYDVAGRAQTSPALVGVPLTIAASARLEGVDPSDVEFDSEAVRRTNGVVSATPQGDTVVQWGAHLAPPQSDAAISLRMVADVADFTIPAIQIALQAGLHTDMSFTGVVASAFDARPESELRHQQRAIELIAAVTDVLARAGTTVAEVRRNLDETSSTLGIRTAERLGESTHQLAASMSAVAGQIDALRSDLAGSVAGVSGAMRSQLVELVTSLNRLLGTASDTSPSAIEGSGCSATMAWGPGPRTVFAAFRQLASSLEGYADVTDGCRDEILAQLDALVGPPDPNPATCDAAPGISATCALAQSQATVLTALDHLTLQGKHLVDQLNTATLQAGLDEHSVVSSQLGLLATAVGEILGHASDTQHWEDLLEQIDTAQLQVEQLALVRTSIGVARGDLASGVTSIREQEEGVAAQLCDLILGGGVVHPEDVEAIRAQLVELRCDGQTPHLPADVPAAGPSVSRIEEAAAQLDTAIEALDPETAGSAVANLTDALAAMEQTATETVTGLLGGETEMQHSAGLLVQLVQEASKANADLGADLALAFAEHEAREQQITAAFAESAATTEAMVGSDVASGIAGLDAQRDVAGAKLAQSYQSLIDGLRASSDSVLSDGNELTNVQKERLAATHQVAVAALHERTTQALERIEHSTSAATRDIRAAAQLLNDSLHTVMRDLGGPKNRGAGILGAMAASAAKSGTADALLAGASQYASGFAHVRSEEMAGIMLRQAQFAAARERSEAIPPFHLELPEGATSQTIFTFALGTAQT